MLYTVLMCLIIVATWILHFAVAVPDMGNMMIRFTFALVVIATCGVNFSKYRSWSVFLALGLLVYYVAILFGWV